MPESAHPRRLTTKAACDLAGLNRDRFNEHVAAGFYECAPPTVAGRARGFDEHALVTLMLFRQLMEDGDTPKRAGLVACIVGLAAAENPTEAEIVLVETYMGRATAWTPADAPTVDLLVSGSTIRRRTFHNVRALRERVQHYMNEFFSLAGEDD